MKKLTLLAIVLVIINSCKKDTPPTVGHTGECPHYGEFVPPNPVAPTVTVGPQYRFPAFNPNNPDEFVYLYLDETTLEIRKFNMSNNDHQTIASNFFVVSRISWSPSGWIVFSNTNDYQLWKVRDNGDELTQITQTGSNLFPNWNSDGSKLYWSFSETLGLAESFLSSDLVQAVPDTIYREYFSNISISDNGRVVGRVRSQTSLYIGVSQMNENELMEFTHLYNISQGEMGYSKDIAISPDGTKVYTSLYNNSAQDGLYIFDTESGSSVKIMDHCHFNSIERLSISPDGNYALIEREHRTWDYIDGSQSMNQILKQSRIYILNLQTGEEELIEID